MEGEGWRLHGVHDLSVQLPSSAKRNYSPPATTRYNHILYTNTARVISYILTPYPPSYPVNEVIHKFYLHTGPP